MNSIEDMNEALNDFNVFFMQFTRIFAKNKNSIVCFFEGSDDVKYYQPRIQNAYNDNWEHVACKGKKSVIDLYELFKRHDHKEYRDAKKTYFIDRDFDPPLSAETRKHIYETPCYSIENFYVSQDCFIKIIKIGFNIQEFKDEDEKIYKQCLSYYEIAQQKFHDKATLLNVWIMLVRNNEREKEISRRKKLNLNNIRFDQLFEIAVNDVKSKYGIDDLQELFNEIDYLTEEIINLEKEQIQKSDKWKIFRGKFEIAFLGKFLRKLQSDLNNKSPKFFEKRRKIKFNFSESNILSELSNHADTPPCLPKYLKDIASQAGNVE